ncbi:MAG: hypothetical protein K2F99_05355 [Muribaculaceae bacterium]|nr:hypothetical protein [Muribaculaceae bacterium]
MAKVPYPHYTYDNPCDDVQKTFGIYWQAAHDWLEGVGLTEDQVISIARIVDEMIDDEDLRASTIDVSEYYDPMTEIEMAPRWDPTPTYQRSSRPSRGRGSSYTRYKSPTRASDDDEDWKPPKCPWKAEVPTEGASFAERIKRKLRGY